MRATRAIIHLENLEHNIDEIKNLVNKDTKLCMPVKADAYGHGAIECAKVAVKKGVYCLAVATVDEGIELRKAGLKCPILLFSLPCAEEFANVCTYEISPFVFDEKFIDDLQQVAFRLDKKVNVYLKVDSGMGRIGCKITDAQRLAAKITSYPNLKLAGVATHLCVSDCVSEEDIAFTNKQIENFDWAVRSIKAAHINPGIVTCSASGGVLLYAKKAQFDMVRPGILFYGYYPDPCVKEYLEKDNGYAPEFKPVMELKTKIESIKSVDKGTSVSYGRTWFAPEDTNIATLPIGYADGLLRHFAGKLNVRIGEQLYPVVGRICMDQCMVDLGKNTDVKVWDEVTVFGLEENDNTAESLAQMTDTISYEITCMVNKRVPRVYIK